MARKKAIVQNVNQKMVNLDELDQIHEADKVILGDGAGCVFSTDCRETGLNKNVLVVGVSGSVKTMSVA